ncbi:hypothetical protein ACQEUX_15255 [Micromonospora sp. CA-259024]|uniref:hypothetical protein n=1 Tax=Micromonospora sp. CA-259024 TaxID=3239965 RepID=UPI003D8F7A65
MTNGLPGRLLQRRDNPHRTSFLEVGAFVAPAREALWALALVLEYSLARLRWWATRPTNGGMGSCRDA